MCCNEDLKTAFCPHCGQPNKKMNRLTMLLAMCESNRRNNETRVAREKERLADEQLQKDWPRFERHMKARQKAAQRWKETADQLREAIAALEEATNFREDQ